MRFGFACSSVALAAIVGCGGGSDASGGGGAGASGGSGGGASADAFVRVDQAGYPSAEPKTALVMSASARSFTAEVLDHDGRVVATVEPGADLGAWNDRYRHVFPVDLAAIHDPGTYVLRALGVRSPPFSIGAPTDLYRPLLEDAAFFFRVQRDGADVDPSALSRKPAHLTDASAMVYDPPSYADDVLKSDLASVGGPIDVEGGWFDAGDYLKFVETTSYVEAVLLIAARDHRKTIAPTSLPVEARRGIDWLRKAWDDETRTLYYQVGIGDGNAHFAGDHDDWRLPEGDDDLHAAAGSRRYFVEHRPVFRVGPPGTPVSPNLAGRLAADFGLCAQVYRATDAGLADACLLAGARIFDAAETSGGKLLTVSPHDYYPETAWRDDLELGAAEMALGLRAASAPPPGVDHDADFYVSQAAHWASEYMTHESGGDSLNLYDVGALAHRELALALAGGAPSGVEVHRADLLGDLRDQLHAAEAASRRDPFAFGIGYGDGDAAPHAFGLALTASFYVELGGGDAFAALGRAQRDWLYGQNAWGASFVVGAGTGFPRCLHHQIANLVGSLDGTDPILRGAVVDGPTEPSDFAGLGGYGDMRACPKTKSDPFAVFSTPEARYRDVSYGWPSVEPGIDYSVLQVLMYARAIDATK